MTIIQTVTVHPPAKMRQVRKSREARSAEIIEAAAKVFMRDGYAVFSLRSVAAEVGIRLSSLQHHFPSREELLTATLNTVLTDWNARFREIADRREVSVLERLRLILRHNLDLMLELPVAALLLELFAMAQHEEFALRFAQNGYLSFRRILMTLLAEERPDIDEDRLMAHATLIASQMEGLMIFTRPGDPAGLPTEAVRDALDAFAEGCLTVVARLERRGDAAGLRSAKMPSTARGTSRPCP